MHQRGFSLIEVLLALSLLAGALTAFAQLFVRTSQATHDARRAALASVLAVQKIEQLRSVAEALAPQPGGSIRTNVDGLCDFLDEHGRPLGGGVRPPAGTVFTRRWSIESLPGDPTSTLLLRASVMPRMWRGSLANASGDPRLFGGAEIVAVATRRAR